MQIVYVKDSDSSYRDIFVWFTCMTMWEKQILARPSNSRKKIWDNHTFSEIILKVTIKMRGGTAPINFFLAIIKIFVSHMVINHAKLIYL